MCTFILRQHIYKKKLKRIDAILSHKVLSLGAHTFRSIVDASGYELVKPKAKLTPIHYYQLQAHARARTQSVFIIISTIFPCVQFTSTVNKPNFA